MFTTANVADACLRLGVPVRCAPPAVRPLTAGSRIAGHVVPVVHYGSVDIFLEAIAEAQPGSVLVVDNQGRTDEACVGDLVALEAREAGLAGIVIWGAHRDSEQIRRCGLPLYSIGTYPTGPMRLDVRSPRAFFEAWIGDQRVTLEDHVFADDDGITFVHRSSLREVSRVARDIHQRETEQARDVCGGRPLREQLDLAGFLRTRDRNPDATFRDHIRHIAGEIEVEWV